MVNNPIPKDLPAECRKCAKIIDHFVKPEKGKGPDQLIPSDIIAKAKGIAILTVMKAGFLLSARGGSGLVVARLEDGGWSAPSAIGSAGMGFGAQIGGEVTDFVIVLNTKDAVKAFSHGNATLGGNLSVAAGPIGRSAEASGTVGNLAAVYSYSKTKGIFAGISIEGTAIIERKEANSEFYNRKISAKELLSGSVPPPGAAKPLYDALNRRIRDASDTNSYVGPKSRLPTQNSQEFSSASSSQGNLNQIQNNQTVNPFEQASQPVQPFRPPPVVPRTSNSAVALYDFVGQQAGDLSFKKGDIILITQKTESQDDWWTGKCNGRDGIFPANYVQLT